MKKLFVLTGVALLLLTGCSKKEEKNTSSGSSWTPATTSFTLQDETVAHGELKERMEGDVIEIREKLFIAQTNDIYLNVEDYLGRTVRYEGIYETFLDDQTGETWHYVIRYGPGCCGYDGTAGFEVVWDAAYPEPNDWVEATGVLELEDYNGWPVLVVRLDSLKVLDVRGAETVTQ